jgi:hypothetical protein
MERFLSSLENALKDKNWYAALFIGLALPDICGKLETPNNSVGDRYRAWVKKYLEPKYTLKIGPEKQKHIFLSAEDCYALRCSYLHEGTDDITEQKARKILESFLFIEPPNKGSIHLNQSNQKLQLQVDIFCNDIIAGVKQWIIDTQDIKEITESINKE